MSPLPASELTIGMYLEHRFEQAKSFSVIKTASAAIAHMHQLNLHTGEPTKGALVSMIRKAAARELGVAPSNLKEPWQWLHIRDFANFYCTPTTAERNFWSRWRQLQYSSALVGMTTFEHFSGRPWIFPEPVS